jgi:hypothetical protein
VTEEPLPDDAAAVRDAAVGQLRRALAEDPVRRTAAVGEPLPVRSPRGELDSWFVPVVMGDVLVGFALLERTLVLRRWSTFQRRAGSLDGCPPAASWLDPDRVARVAAGVAADTAGSPPYLSYDGSPDRLAWAVPLPGGRTVYVAGDAAWVSTPRRETT